MARQAHTRPVQPAPAAPEGFKPVALPALAAALRLARGAERRDERSRELPPILRKDAVLG
ncbi:MAG TPA: hypothetical protein VEA41_22500 [Salinarimonas sp.]|jgi:hypothetical protein|nr:hypothetical protein [Salinarimonas sp.]